MSGEWHRVAALSALDPEVPLGVTVAGIPIALYRLDDGVFALGDICPHQNVRLSEGFLDGDRIECPLHQSCFEIRTGKVLGPPARDDVKSYPVRVEGDDVLVSVG